MRWLGWKGWLAAGTAAGLLGWQAVRGRRVIALGGRVVLMAGGVRGLGLFVARELARRGCRLVIAAPDDEGLAAAERDLGLRGADVVAIPCALHDRAEVERVVGEVIARYERIDVLVNAVELSPAPAGAQPAAGELSVAAFERAMEASFWDPLHATLAVLPHMRSRRGGRIVNITPSAAGERLAGACAQSAALGLSEGLHAELARHDILVTTVEPGQVRLEPPRPTHAIARLPVTAVSPRVAARRIVEALRRGDAEVSLTAAGRIGRVVRALVPGVVGEISGAAGRLLEPPLGFVRS